MVVSRSLTKVKPEMKLIICQLLPQIYHSSTNTTHRSRPGHYILAPDIRRQRQPGCLDSHFHGGDYRNQLLRREALW
jgi:hypothetical protein